MNILFMHPTCPGQFMYLARFFVNNPKNKVAFICKNVENPIDGVLLVCYKPDREPDPNMHPFLQPIEEAVNNGIGGYKAARFLKDEHGFVPDIIVAHSGWGDAMYLKDLYPDVPILCYFEWFYRGYGSDVGYFPQDNVTPDTLLSVRTKNAHHLLCLDFADAGFSPTEWQRSQFPDEYKPKISVMHEGVDIDFVKPDPGYKLVLPLEKEKIDLSDVDEVITYVSRGFEPYRGFPQFMEALAMVLNDRPKAHAVILGSDRVFYGAPLEEGKTYRNEILEQMKDKLDMSRVHFTGFIPREAYVKVLQASTIHVYLTRPFVLSWSMMDAMGAGCCLIASKTPPVEEMVKDGENGLLVNFMSPEHIAMRMVEALDNPELRKRLSKNARQTIVDKYSLRECLLKQANFIYSHLK